MLANSVYSANIVFVELQTLKGGTDSTPLLVDFFVPDRYGQESSYRKNGGSPFGCLKLLSTFIGGVFFKKTKEAIMAATQNNTQEPLTPMLQQDLAYRVRCRLLYLQDHTQLKNDDVCLADDAQYGEFLFLQDIIDDIKQLEGNNNE